MYRNSILLDTFFILSRGLGKGGVGECARTSFPDTKNLPLFLHLFTFGEKRKVAYSTRVFSKL
jgi:hypothetical protein